jgi:dihydroorotase/N-acyl-D-amino-acid deacylase
VTIGALVRRWRSALGSSLIAMSAGSLAAQSAPFDLLLKNARIVDGTGSPWYRADLAIRHDSIVRIAFNITEAARRTIDVRGQVVAPGFIDIHSHARRGIFDVPTADNDIRMGVTTVIEGPDGSSPVPLAPFLARLDSLKKSINIGAFIGQGSVRSAVMGDVDRKATPDEIARMRTLVEQGMRDGAFGLSSGLFYVPGTFTPTDEVIELAKVAGRFGGIYISHMRDEAKGVVASVKETIRIGEEGGLPTQITHHKVVGPGYWGASVETLRLVEEARARGVDATIDQYPYTASATSIAAALLPAWALEGTNAAVQARLKDPATRARIKTEGHPDPQAGARRWRRQERRDRTLCLRSDARRQESRGHHDTSRHGAHARQRGGVGDVDRREGWLSGDLPRDQRGRSRPHPALPRYHDRDGRRDSHLRQEQSASAQLRHVRPRARRLRP